MSSVLALSTFVPTSPSLSSWRSIVISARCCRLSTLSAGPMLSMAAPMTSFSLTSVAVSRLIESIAAMMSSFCSSSAADHRSRLPSRCRAWSCRPLSILFISTLIVFSWPMPPPLSSIDRAPSTSSTSGLRPVRDSGMTSPSESRSALAVPGGGLDQGDVLLAQQAGLADVDLDVRRELDVLADQELDPRVPADPLDVGDLPDDDVVGHHRGAGHHVEGVREVGGHLVGSRPCPPCCPGSGRS